jgi:hypothetical protein
LTDGLMDLWKEAESDDGLRSITQDLLSGRSELWGLIYPKVEIIYVFTFPHGRRSRRPRTPDDSKSYRL